MAERIQVEFVYIIFRGVGRVVEGNLYERLVFRVFVDIEGSEG